MANFWPRHLKNYQSKTRTGQTRVPSDNRIITGTEDSMLTRALNHYP